MAELKFPLGEKRRVVSIQRPQQSFPTVLLKSLLIDKNESGSLIQQIFRIEIRNFFRTKA